MLNKIMIYALLLISLPIHAVKISPYVGIEALESAINEFIEDCGYLPSSETGLNTLLISKLECWEGPYVRKSMLFDQYGNDYIYQQLLIKKSMKSFIVISVGKDGVQGTNDDISSDDNAARKEIVNKNLKSNENDLPWVVIYIIYGFIVGVILVVLAVIKNKRTN